MRNSKSIRNIFPAIVVIAACGGNQEPSVEAGSDQFAVVPGRHDSADRNSIFGRCEPFEYLPVGQVETAVVWDDTNQTPVQIRLDSPVKLWAGRPNIEFLDVTWDLTSTAAPSLPDWATRSRFGLEFTFERPAPHVLAVGATTDNEGYLGSFRVDETHNRVYFERGATTTMDRSSYTMTLSPTAEITEIWVLGEADEFGIQVNPATTEANPAFEFNITILNGELCHSSSPNPSPGRLDGPGLR